jgi:hypothetical protein
MLAWIPLSPRPPLWEWVLAVGMNAYLAASSLWEWVPAVGLVTHQQEYV